MAAKPPPCPICGAELGRGPTHAPPYLDVNAYSCPRCGTFLLSGLLRNGRLGRATDAERLALSRFLRLQQDASEGGFQDPLIPANFEALVASGQGPVGPLQQLDEVVRLVANRTANLGDQTEPEDSAVWAARLGLPSATQFDALTSAGRDAGLLDVAQRVGTRTGIVLSLTLSGWQRAATLGERPTVAAAHPPVHLSTVGGEVGDGGEAAMSDGTSSKESRLPRTFISYAWESNDHQEWVKALATRLRNDGVNVVLDRWEVQLGDQLPQFMETQVRESDFILLICTPTFKSKSDNRKGGVGYEGHVITAAALSGADPARFVPVLREGDAASSTPTWLSGKMFADLRGEGSEAEYERLLRHLHDDAEPAPPIGTYVKRSGSKVLRAPPQAAGGPATSAPNPSASAAGLERFRVSTQASALATYYPVFLNNGGRRAFVLTFVDGSVQTGVPTSGSFMNPRDPDASFRFQVGDQTYRVPFRELASAEPILEPEEVVLQALQTLADATGHVSTDEVGIRGALGDRHRGLDVHELMIRLRAARAFDDAYFESGVPGSTRFVVTIRPRQGR